MASIAKSIITPIEPAAVAVSQNSFRRHRLQGIKPAIVLQTKIPLKATRSVAQMGSRKHPTTPTTSGRASMRLKKNPRDAVEKLSTRTAGAAVHVGAIDEPSTATGLQGQQQTLLHAVLKKTVKSTPSIKRRRSFSACSPRATNRIPLPLQKNIRPDQPTAATKIAQLEKEKEALMVRILQVNKELQSLSRAKLSGSAAVTDSHKIASRRRSKSFQCTASDMVSETEESFHMNLIPQNPPTEDSVFGPPSASVGSSPLLSAAQRCHKVVCRH